MCRDSIPRSARSPFAPCAKAQVVGIRHGWLGAVSIVRDKHADNSEHFQILTEEIVNRAARTGGTFLHTSRTNPSAVKKEEVPEALRATFNQEKNDLTSEVIEPGLVGN